MGQDHPSSPLTLFIEKLQRRCTLSDDDCEALRSLPFTVQRHDAARYLARAGDQNLSVMVLVSGYVHRHRVLSNGSRQIVAVHLAGDLLTLPHAASRRATESLQALTPIKVVEIAPAPMIALSRERPAIAEALLLESIADASIFREWVINLGRRDARTRTAHLLCELGTRSAENDLGDRTTFRLPLTQEQLADILGLTSVHVNRTLRGMKSSGLIDYGNGWVSVPDWTKLSKEADFDASYLSMDPV
ncbi:Crp/Fnr family transcriptional regulator [Sphingomonas sp.]|jgi:CRP-like cAMP-binding protein|uniref:Crp/Fnr family transcriptional regulator n=1 Tax=Sphingomonas sp. TaxID=28214 RepID=UPI002628BF52|nr:Crp/Fnr family transcriptional regulator [Sphingomonas sp.]MDF2495480.1 hypothetical protein [Sphingomonas sp.]